ncbi:MAG: rhodanese-like domain-containing protein [Pseudomonadota bacterium]|jgi:rhodanese-related sulfurtransferase|nr:rhodanese-like domain-containing protein [Pseudomonadota bacterium]
MYNFKILVACIFSVLWAPVLQAEQEPLPITSDLESISFNSIEGPVTIRRFANDIMLVKGTVRPMVPVSGVTPVGELEVISALQDSDYIVVDTRTKETQFGGTIPGTVNFPFNEIADRLDELGCEGSAAGWNCQEALEVVLYCNGPNCGQSPRAMSAMVAAGFPATKISYYRGGMLAWTSLGLTTRESDHSD